MAEQNTPDILDLLLSAVPHVPEKDLRMKRLSEELSADVIFRVRAVGYNTISEFIKGKADSDLLIVLEGLVSPNLKDQRLLAKYKAATPLELLKNPSFLLPGDVAELSLEIERLSGYRVDSFEDVVKN